MKAYLKVFTMLFLFLTITMMYHVQGHEENEVEILGKAFSSSNAKLDFYNLQFSKYYGKYNNDGLLLKQGNEISSIMDIPAISNLKNNKGYKIYVNKGKWDTGSEVQIIINRSSKKSNELYLIFKLTGYSSLEALKKDYSKLTKILQDNLNSIKINSCIQGSIYVNLDNTRQCAVIDRILHKIRAKRVESFESNLVKSISAYSKNFENYILTGNKKMNFQISTHYDNIHKKTILTLGTPIINIEY